MNQPAFGDVTDFKTGRDFKLIKTIRKSGDMTYPNYESSHFLEESPAGAPDQCKQWMENLHDIVSLRVLKSAEELENELMVHLGLKQETSSNFDPSKYKSSSASVSTSSASTIKAKQVVEQDEIEDSVAPVATKVSKKSSEEPSSDEDEEIADKDFLEELRKLT
jgi:hypothetical protein